MLQWISGNSSYLGKAAIHVVLHQVEVVGSQLGPSLRFQDGQTLELRVGERRGTRRIEAALQEPRKQTGNHVKKLVRLAWKASSEIAFSFITSRLFVLFVKQQCGECQEVTESFMESFESDRGIQVLTKWAGTEILRCGLAVATSLTDDSDDCCSRLLRRLPRAVAFSSAAELASCSRNRALALSVRCASTGAAAAASEEHRSRSGPCDEAVSSEVLRRRRLPLSSRPFSASPPWRRSCR